MDATQARDRLLEATLAHVPEVGWSRRAARLGAQRLGEPASAVEAQFPRGTRDLVVYFDQWADRKMLARLADSDMASLRVREKVALGVRTRLEVLVPHKEAARLAALWLAHPCRKPLAARLVFETCDKIWRAAGDTATDWSRYSKRGLLAAVYTSTTAYFFADSSAEHSATWRFLDRRIDNVMQIPKLRQRASQAAGKAAETAKRPGEALRRRAPGR